MTRHAYVLSVVLLLGGLFTLPGCGNEGSKDASDAAKPGGAEAAGQAAKKYILRYNLTAGDRSALVMKMKSLGGTAAMPPVAMWMDITIDSVTAEEFSYSFQFTDMTINGDPLPPEIKGILGVKGRARCTSRGETLSAEFLVPDDAPDLLKTTLKGMEKQIREMSCPLPEQAVGVGDTWTISQTVSTGVFSIDQTATYTLKACDGKRCLFDVKVDQKADRQEMKLPALPEGMEATLDSLTGEGAGTLEIELSNALPIRSSVEIASKFSMIIGGTSQEQSSKMLVTLSSE